LEFPAAFVTIVSGFSLETSSHFRFPSGSSRKAFVAEHYNSEQGIIYPYIYVLARYLVILQEHIDMAEEGVDYNIIRYCEPGNAEHVGWVEARDPTAPYNVGFSTQPTRLETE
jgi:hypothetical protein